MQKIKTGTDRLAAIQEASTLYNAQRRDKLVGEKDISELVRVENPKQMRCTICGQHGIEERHGSGWLLVKGYCVCPACFSDSGADPAEIKRRVRQRQAMYANLVQCVPVLGTIS